MKQQNKNINSSSRHPRGLLSGVSLIGYLEKGKALFTTAKQAGDSRTLRAARHSGMTTLFNAQAFTLVELLIVVIVLAVLATVAVPKFTSVLEVRKTTEAEQMLSAVRTEQEKRCIAGKPYLTDKSDLAVMADSNRSANYTYQLNAVGAEATSKSKNYKLAIPSYKSGQLCCEGAFCEKLNKNYPICSHEEIYDECAGAVSVEPPDESECPGSGPSLPPARTCNTCGTQTPSRGCNTETGNWYIAWSECSVSDESECEPEQEECTAPKSKWDDKNKRCVCPGSYDYYVASTGACCSYQTPKTNSSCWWLSHKFQWSEAGTRTFSGTYGPFGWVPQDCSKQQHPSCATGVAVGVGCVEEAPNETVPGSTGEVCTLSCQYSESTQYNYATRQDDKVWTRTEHYVVCSNTKEVYTPLWNASTMHNY